MATRRHFTQEYKDQAVSLVLDYGPTYGTCLHSIPWSTAAMLSARFPTVTPAGRVPGCGGHRPAADRRGDADGSGIGTVPHLAPRLAELVRDHNAVPGVSIVGPIVVHLEDETRGSSSLRSRGGCPSCSCRWSAPARWTSRRERQPAVVRHGWARRPSGGSFYDPQIHHQMQNPVLDRCG